MPQPLAHFLSQTLQYRLDVALDQLRKARSEWFDYNHPHVQKSYTTFITTINKHGHIPAEAWEKTLSQAVRYVTAYLVRPVSTLVEFVYHDAEEPLAPHVVYRRMSYFGSYSYFREATEAYFERKQLAALERDRYVSLLTRVDQHLTQKYTPEQWIRLLQPLFSLVTMAYPAGLPIPLLRMFFAEKGANVVERTLGEEQAKWGVDLLDATSLRKILTNLTRPVPRTAPQLSASPQPAPDLPQAPTAVAAPSTQIPSQPPLAPHPLPSPSSHAPSPPESSTSSVPLWKQFQQRDQPAPPQGGSVLQRPTPAPTPTTPPATDTEGVPLWKRFQQNATPSTSQAPQPTQGPTTSKLLQLEQAVLGPQGPRLRERFVRHLFNGSLQAYAETLDQLSTTPTWAQASQIIARDVFQRFQVNIYDDHAVAFTNTVEARYQTT